MERALRWTPDHGRFMRQLVNLLLLLSALLSALTGGASAMRAPTAAHAVSCAATAVQTKAALAIASRRPQQALPGLRTFAASPFAIVQSFAEAAPLYASRRRE